MIPRAASILGALLVRPWVRGLALAVSLAGPLAAQATREYDLKAVFLYNFTTFVEWPKEARPAPGKPFIIGVLGRDPFGAVLDGVVAGESLNGTPLEVRRYRTAETARECQILFISSSEAAHLPQILDTLRGRPVLTVADMPRFSESGGIIAFSTGTRVQLHINAEAARQAGLSISSKLMRVATLVGQPPPP
jgi:hypothetical protein